MSVPAGAQDRYGIEDAATLVERKRARERVGLDSALLEAWRPRVDGLFARLDEAREKSPLPEGPPNALEGERGAPQGTPLPARCGAIGGTVVLSRRGRAARGAYAVTSGVVLS
jgi:hypothetical protein